MDKNEAKKRIEKLREQIEDLRYRYHVLDDPKVTDDIYESLQRELKALEGYRSLMMNFPRPTAWPASPWISLLKLSTTCACCL